MIQFNDIKTIEDVKAYNRGNGFHFFSAGAMQWFNSKIENRVLHGSVDDEPVVFFVTSERFVKVYPDRRANSKNNATHRRYWTARALRADGSILSVSGFQGCNSVLEAWEFILSINQSK